MSLSPNSWQSAIKGQWQEPHDIFSLLLIIGGDIIQKAIAQLAGGPYPVTPVAFSFGWVSYSILAVMSVLGDGTLMPPPDTPCVLIDVRKGYSRRNHSWVLGRILRDWHEDGEKLTHSLEISFCSASIQEAGIPHPDIVWFFAVAVIISQLVVSIIPIFIDGTWTIFILTFSGTLLALGQASLPQWKLEKWSCRQNTSDRVVCLTQGNGSRRVIIIDCKKNAGLDLGDLASPRTRKLTSTLPWTVFFCICWLCHLLTATGIQTYAWYMLFIGGIGTVQNVFAVGAKREPPAFGLHLHKEAFICPNDNVANKVMAVIQEAEKRKPGLRLGLSLVDIFFPGRGGLHPSEKQWVRVQEEKYAELDPPLTPSLNPTELGWRRRELEKYTKFDLLGLQGATIV